MVTLESVTTPAFKKDKLMNLIKTNEERADRMPDWRVLGLKIGRFLWQQIQMRLKTKNMRVTIARRQWH